LSLPQLPGWCAAHSWSTDGSLPLRCGSPCPPPFSCPTESQRVMLGVSADLQDLLCGLPGSCLLLWMPQGTSQRESGETINGWGWGGAYGGSPWVPGSKGQCSHVGLCGAQDSPTETKEILPVPLHIICIYLCAWSPPPSPPLPAA
jgi:hypothetical protein